MNRLIITFFFCLLTFALSACVKQQAQTPLVYSDWHYEKRTLIEKNKDLPYTIDLHYPEILSQPTTASAQELNRLIRDYISQNIKNFKEALPQDNSELRDYPVEMRHNTLRVRYTATLLRPRQHTIASIRFESNTIFLGEADQVHRYAVFNYDLSENKMLTLDSLFKPHSDYLKLLAKACQKKLDASIAERMPWMPWDLEGTQAKPENFTLWNLKRKGLLLTLKGYQVTPYSDTAQTILVPYSSLRSVLSPDSPVTAYAYS